jgi:hypothetical protein
MSRIISFLLVSVPLLSLGCAHSRKPGAFVDARYDGPRRPDSELATVAPIPPVYTLTVDGSSSESDRGSGFVDGYLIRLLPGRHTISAKYFDGRQYSVKPLEFTFYVFAGHRYEVQANMRMLGSETGWRPVVVDVASGRTVPTFNPHGPLPPTPPAPAANAR